MVVRMRHTRSHTRNRRSHHALVLGAMVKCSDCGAQRMRHQACSACGRYRGRVVIDVAGKATKKAEKRAKRSAEHAHAHESAKAEESKSEAKK